MKDKITRVGEGQILNVLGDHQLVKLTSEESNGALAVIIQHMEPGLEVPRHVHVMEDEHFHLLEGDVQFEVDDKIVDLTAGDMIFLPRGIPHAIRVMGFDTAVVRLTITPGGLEKMFMELNGLPDGPPDMTKVVEICENYGVSFV